MNPLPIFHRSSAASPGATIYKSFVSNWEADLATMWTYSHTLEVLVEFLGNLEGELTAIYWHTVTSPVL